MTSDRNQYNVFCVCFFFCHSSLSHSPGVCVSVSWNCFCHTFDVCWLHPQTKVRNYFLKYNGVHLATKFMLMTCNLNTLAHHWNLISCVRRLAQQYQQQQRRRRWQENEKHLSLCDGIEQQQPKKKKKSRLKSSHHTSQCLCWHMVIEVGSDWVSESHFIVKNNISSINCPIWAMLNEIWYGYGFESILFFFYQLEFNPLRSLNQMEMSWCSSIHKIYAQKSHHQLRARE